MLFQGEQSRTLSRGCTFTTYVCEREQRAKQEKGMKEHKANRK